MVPSVVAASLPVKIAKLSLLFRQSTTGFSPRTDTLSSDDSASVRVGSTAAGYADCCLGSCRRHVAGVAPPLSGFRYRFRFRSRAARTAFSNTFSYLAKGAQDTGLLSASRPSDDAASPGQVGVQETSGMTSPDLCCAAQIRLPCRYIRGKGR